jgi:hypothetical protein
MPVQTHCRLVWMLSQRFSRSGPEENFGKKTDFSSSSETARTFYRLASFFPQNYAPRPVFFARKFDPFVDLKIINRVLSERSGTQISKNRDLSVDEASAVWKRHWLNLHSSDDFHSSPVTEVLFESLKRLSARAVIKSPSDEELGKILGVHVTVDLQGKRNLLLVQKTKEETGQMVTFESFVGFIDHFKRDPRHLMVDKSPVHRILNIQVAFE